MYMYMCNFELFQSKTIIQTVVIQHFATVQNEHVHVHVASIVANIHSLTYNSYHS